MYTKTLFGALLFAAGAIAKVDQVLYAKSSDLDEHLRREASQLLTSFDKRQDAMANFPMGPALGSSGDLNTTNFNRQAAGNCAQAVTNLEGVVGNPSGISACYNVAFVDPQSGAFESEVRLYNISAGTGNWSGIELNSMSITVSYQGATVAQETVSQPFKRDVEEEDYATSYKRSVPNMIEAVMTLGYNGQFSQDVSGFNNSALQQALIPQIQLTANGQSVELESPETSFVSGVFMDIPSVPEPATKASFADGSIFHDVVPTNVLTAPNAPPSVKAGLPQLVIADPTITPYRLPGVQFRIEPFGLIVTGIWTVLFTATCCGGAALKAQSRNQYRLNVKTRQANSFQRI